MVRFPPLGPAVRECRSTPDLGVGDLEGTGDGGFERLLAWASGWFGRCSAVSVAYEAAVVLVMHLVRAR